MDGKANRKKVGGQKAQSKRKRMLKPISPCANCSEREKAALGACNNGFGICKEYMDYQSRLWELNNT